MPPAENSAIRTPTNCGKSLRTSPSMTMKARMKQKNSSKWSRPFLHLKASRRSPQPQVLETTFEARVWDYMAAHTKRMERFENAIFKQREGINSRMTEMFGLLKELTTNRTPEKVLIREEAKFPVIKNVNSISLTKGEEERSNKKEITPDNTERPTKTEAEMPVKKAETKNEAENRARNKSIKTPENEEVVEAPGSQPEPKLERRKTYKVLPRGPVYDVILKKKITKKEDIGGNFEIPCNIGGQKGINALVDQGSDVNVMPYSTYMKLTDERPIETNIRLSLASHSYIYSLGIAEDVLLEVAEHVYPVDFMILDIKENENRPFILGTPFLTTAKATIRFDKGTITLRSGKSKVSFHRIPDPLCMTDKRVKNDIEPIAPTMTVNRLILEWEEKIKLHLEMEMKFNQWRSKSFKGKHPTLMATKEEMDDEGEVIYDNNRRRPNNTNGNWSNNNGNNGNKGNYDSLLCKNCGLKGHTIERCFEVIGYPPGFKRNPNLKPSGSFNNSKTNFSDTKGNNDVKTSTGTVSLTNDQVMKLMSLLNDKGGSTTNAHMAVNVSELNLTVGHPNGTLAKITHVGNLKLNNNVVLFDVLVIPEYTVSLLSVNKLIKDSKVNVCFDETKCYIQDLKKEKVLGTGRESAGLLGHPANQVLKLLRESLNLSNIDHNGPCEVCHKAKQTRESFPLSEHKTTCFGELIHIDVWGLYKVVSREGFRLPSSVLNGKSPFSLIYDREPNLSHLRSFGCLCFATVVKGSDKFSHRSENCILIGYASGKKAYKLFSLENRNVLYSRDVTFYETIFPYKMSNNEPVNESKNINFFDHFEVEIETKTSNLSPNDDEEGSSGRDGRVQQLVSDANTDQPGYGETYPATPLDENNVFEGNVGTSEEVPIFQIDLPMHTEEVGPRRSHRTSKMPARLNDFVLDNKVKYGFNRYANQIMLSSENYGFVSNLNKSVEPSSYEEALKDINLINVMHEEINALYENKTWVMTGLPFDRNPNGCTWVFKIKYKSNGEVERYKARLVAKAFGQKEGIDYEETFSPMVKMSIVRCLINLVVQKDWKIYQMDVNNAFLYGDLKEEVYMLPPPGDVNLYLLVYVDDLVITGNNNEEIDNFKSFLNKKFKIKDLGELKYFLEIEVFKTKGGLCLNQRKYCLELLHEYGLLACRPIMTPLPENLVLNHKETKTDKYLINVTNYQKLIGKLIYLTHTRPDISYSVHCLSQHMHAPLKSHFDIVLRVLKYLKLAPGLGVEFVKRESGCVVSTYSDSDWAKCPMTRRSVSGYCVFINGNLVSWESKRQATLSKSSAEAEYRFMASTTSEIMWIVKILSEFGFSNVVPAELFCDNKEKVASGLIKTVKVDTKAQVADILTKALGTYQHSFAVKKLGLLNMFAS
ncbi:ribonuclease H-like domain-containing protein [Tanacetum coccineum]